MATNEEILDAYVRQDELKDQAQDLTRIIKNAQAKLAKVEAELELAKAVGSVVDGIAIQVVGDTEATFDMNTLAKGPDIVLRDVYGYKHVSDGNWLVRVNAGELGTSYYQGGKVLGTGASWTRDEAKAIALRWLKGDESVLSLRT